jgi:DNA polymerase (family 10)
VGAQSAAAVKKRAAKPKTAAPPPRVTSIRNVEIADLFDEVADVLDVRGDNPFRIRAYRNAARNLRSYGTEAAELVARGEDLRKIPSIGADLALRITELVETGKSAALERIRKGVPAIALELLKIPGIGPKRARLLFEELDIHSLKQLHRAALDRRLRDLKGLGAKVEDAVLQALDKAAATPERVKLAAAASYADALTAHLKKAPGIARVVVAGSFRRGMETVGDLDILATAKEGKPVIDHFTGFDQVQRVLASGTTRATVVLRSGLQVDLRVVPEESYGAALYYFTGSKAHNIAVRSIAQKRGLKISEYGVFRGEKQIACATEESVLAAVGLPFIPPELRENRGEIEAARKGALPKLVELSDLKGDLHVHSAYTDGQNTIREMAKAAAARRLSYIAITDHSQKLKMVHGLDPRRLHQEMDEIERLRGERLGIEILKGIEVDILDDGGLDLPDDVLARLDLVIGAIHSKFNLSRAAQTERILRAMDHPHFTILAHPSGRLMSAREPYDVDMTRIIRAAADRRCFLELNADPDRLDLKDIYCQEAKAEGVLLSIGSDAHRTEGFANLRFGVLQARRGWLEKEDVLNARPLSELRKLLKRTMLGRESFPRARRPLSGALRRLRR